MRDIFLAWFGSTLVPAVVQSDHVVLSYDETSSGMTGGFDEYENDVNHKLWPPLSPHLHPVERPWEVEAVVDTEHLMETRGIGFSFNVSPICSYGVDSSHL